MGKEAFAKQLMRLNSSNYIIAYLDILGASKFMAEDSEFFLNDLNIIHEEAIRDVAFTNVITKKDISIKIFSDNILIAVKTTKNDINRKDKIEKMFNLAGNIYINALNKGYLIRGAITEGKFYKNETFVFGKALVEAVNIEESIAIYPRIILQDSLIPFASEYALQDNDGKYYLNCFIYPTGLKHVNYKYQILEQLKLNKDKEEIKQKIMWLVSYFNSFYSSPLARAVEHPQISSEDISEALLSNNIENSEVANAC